MKVSASVFILTKNSEKYLRLCLESIKHFEEIIIIDSGSTDSTIKICKEYNANIYHNPWPGFAAQKEFALSKCGLPWVLNLDSDEEISAEAIESIRCVINSGKYVGLEFKMHNYLFGRRPHIFTAPMKKLRFGRKDLARYDLSNPVHEGMIISGKIGRASGHINHYGEDSLHVFIEKINNYSTLRARTKVSRGGVIVCISGTISFLIAFVKHYILKRHFLNGAHGFASAFIVGFHAWLKRMKVIIR